MSQLIPASISTPTSRIITADVAAPTPIQIINTPQVMLHNTGTVLAYFGWGTTAALATAGAVIPVGATAGGYPVAPGQKEVITPIRPEVGAAAQTPLFITAIASASCVTFATPCLGS